MRLTVRLRPGTEARFPGVACKEAALARETPTISHARTHARNGYIVKMADDIRIKEGLDTEITRCACVCARARQGEFALCDKMAFQTPTGDIFLLHFGLDVTSGRHAREHLPTAVCVRNKDMKHTQGFNLFTQLLSNNNIFISLQNRFDTFF